MADLLGPGPAEGDAQEPLGEGHLGAWLGAGCGYLNDPNDPSVHRAVVFSVVTANGPLAGLLDPAFARLLGEQLVEHGENCVSVEVRVVKGDEARNLLRDLRADPRAN